MKIPDHIKNRDEYILGWNAAVKACLKEWEVWMDDNEHSDFQGIDIGGLHNQMEDLIK